MRKQNILRTLCSSMMIAATIFCATVWMQQEVYASSLTLPLETEKSQEETVKPVLPTESAVLSCTTDGTNVTITGSVSGPTSDPTVYDNYWYLFELQPYEDGLNGRTNYTTWWTKGDSITYSLPLGFKTSSDKLYSKFVLAVYDGTQYYAISEPTYITNPEVLAKNTRAFKNPGTKKGLLLDGGMIADALELGVRNTSINIAFHQILGQGIDYQYDGKTYHFNKDLIEEYDKIVFSMSSKNFLVTAIILNGWNENTPFHHPLLFYVH